MSLLPKILRTIPVVSVFAAASHSSATPSPSELECSSITTVTLANGVEMPKLALGTAHLVTQPGNLSQIPKFTGFLPEHLYRSLHLALEAGIRAVDTALIYRSHTPIRHVIGEWFRTGRLHRSDVFLASKIFHGPIELAFPETYIADLENLTPQQVKETVSSQFRQTLIDLGVGYLDLMLLHWPAAMDSMDPENAARRLAAWQVLEEMYERGWARAIGVSNFSELHLEKLMEDGAKIRPMVNQIEASVFLQFDKIVEYCQQHGIVLQAHSPFGRGLKDITKDTAVLEIAEKHQRDPGQIALRYLIQKGYTVTFLSASEERLKSNQEIFDLELDADDMTKLSLLNRSDGSWGLPSPYGMS